MLAKMPVDIKNLRKDEVDAEILRIGLIAELDAINLYEQLAAMTGDKNLKKVLMAVAKEEKEHVGEFMELLLRLDKEQVEELKEGSDEVKEIIGRE